MIDEKRNFVFDHPWGAPKGEKADFKISTDFKGFREISTDFNRFQGISRDFKRFLAISAKENMHFLIIERCLI